MYYVFDTETYLIAPGRLAPKLVCVSDCEGVTPSLHLAEAGADRVEAKLKDPETTLVGHNVAYDFGVLVQYRPSLMPLVWKAYDEGRILDTMIWDKLICIREGHTKFHPQVGGKPKFSLAALVERYLGQSMSGKESEDAWRYRYHELDGVALDQWPAAARLYALKDAELTYSVLRRLLNDKPADLEAQCRSAWSLHLVSAYGLRTDPVAVGKLKADLHETVSSAMSRLINAGIYRQNGTKDVSRVRAMVSDAYRARGDEPPVTAKGAVSTSRAALEESGDDDLILLASIGAEQKLLSTYVDVLEAGTRRPLNPQYHLVDSGRTSCSRPNIQNQPRRGGVRECFVPREGYIYVGCDYHVAELCGLAQVLVNRYGLESCEMAKALIAGRELHIETAAGILDISYDECLRRYKAGDKDAKKARQLAKALNFGAPGGLGAEKFCDFARASYGLEISVERSRELKDLWLDRYPEMRLYFADIGEMGRFGPFEIEQVHSGRVRGGLGFCDGCNTFFQGIVADGARIALHEVVRATLTAGDALDGSHVVAFVHDELILESPTERAPEAAKRLSELMVAGMTEVIADVPIRAEAHLMERWYKDAEPVLVEGKLIPWRP